MFRKKTLVEEEENDAGTKISHCLLTRMSVCSGMSSGGRDPVGRAEGGE